MRPARRMPMRPSHLIFISLANAEHLPVAVSIQKKWKDGDGETSSSSNSILKALPQEDIFSILGEGEKGRLLVLCHPPSYGLSERTPRGQAQKNLGRTQGRPGSKNCFSICGGALSDSHFRISLNKADWLYQTEFHKLSCLFSAPFDIGPRGPVLPLLSSLFIERAIS